MCDLLPLFLLLLQFFYKARRVRFEILCVWEGDRQTERQVVQKYSYSLWSNKHDKFPFKGISNFNIMFRKQEKNSTINVFFEVLKYHSLEKKNKIKNMRPCIFELSLHILKCHHHVDLLARISLTLSRHPSLLFIAPGTSSRLHPVSAQSCCI